MKNFTLLLLLLLLFACDSSPELSPEEKIKKTIDAIELAAEERSLSRVMEHISDQYADHHGNDKKAIQGLFQFQIIRNQKINIFSVVRDLQVEGRFASAEISTAMASREVDLSEESNRLRADSHRFSVAFAEEDGEWKVRSVTWQRGW